MKTFVFVLILLSEKLLTVMTVFINSIHHYNRIIITAIESNYLSESDKTNTSWRRPVAINIPLDEDLIPRGGDSTGRLDFGVISSSINRNDHW